MNHHLENWEDDKPILKSVKIINGTQFEASVKIGADYKILNFNRKDANNRDTAYFTMVKNLYNNMFSKKHNAKIYVIFEKD